MKIGILGDLCLSYPDSTLPNIDQLIEDYKKSDILQELKQNEFNIVNLEAPITKSNDAIKKTGPNLKNPARVIDILNMTRIKGCTLANNHIYDFGAEGLRDTIEICEKNKIQTTGAAIDSRKLQEPLIIENNKIKVAVINFAENEFNTIDIDPKGTGSNGLDIIDIFNQITKAKLSSDFVIAIAHGGHEQYNFPSPRIKKLYRFLIDIGADALIAHHPHVIQGFEDYKGKPIFYSIGNYFFPSIHKSRTNHEGFAVILEISENNLSYSILPYTQCMDLFSVNLMKEEDKIAFFKKIDKLSKKMFSDDELEKEWQLLLKSRKEYFINSLLPFNPKITYRILRYGLDKLIVPQNHFIKILNLIRCESHRDLLVNSLKKKIYSQN